MRKTTATAVLVASLVAGGGAALVAPGTALGADSTTTSSSATDRAAARLNAIKNALTGLVSDGTITQSQADKVASTLSNADLGRGHGGRGAGRVSAEAIAKVIGITVDQLRAAREAGQTLTQIAQAHGVSKTKLINGLVAAAKTQLAADVTAGRLTQAQADEKSATLTDRITQRVDQVGGGGRHHGHDRNMDTPSPETPSPSTTS